MQKIRNIFVFTIIILGVILIITPVTIPSSLQSSEVIKEISENDFVIVFNSGGWGDTPISKADDFLPIIQGIKENLNDWGYSAVIVPYMRTKEGISSKISGTKDFLSGYSFSSGKFVVELEELVKQFPNKKIILAGLSNGAAFVNEIYRRVSENIKDSLYVIAVGAPFWTDKVENKNVLQIDNNGKDTLSNGEIGSLFLSAIKAPFIWLGANIKGENVSLSKAFRAEGHNYSWSSSDNKEKILIFLENKLR